MTGPARPPGSTYRVQLHPEWTLDDAAATADYVAALGVTHLYCSPYLQAEPGSTHGYDVVDHGSVSAELGGEAARCLLVATLSELGLGQVLDIVPNHVSVATPSRNAWWWDVLRHGPDSRYAGWFDVDWAGGGGRILLPVLDDDVDTLVKRGELVLDGAVLRYRELALPLAPGTESGSLPDVLDEQHYRLAHWREAGHHLNYRRFFDIVALAGIRAERDDVFAATHRLVGEWLARGELDGLRVDHPDGLADPARYFLRLRDLAGPDAWIVAEKILAPGEELPVEWPVDGSTGYDAAALVTGLFVDPAGEEPLTRTYAELTGDPTGWPEVAHQARHGALRDLLDAEVSRLTRVVGGEASAQVRAALVELMACLPVYRTYLHPGRAARDADLAVLGRALAEAQRRRPDLVRVLTRLAQRLTSGSPPELVVRFQQTSGSAMAKGVEDTAFYRYHRLVALNEVGGDPGRWGTSPADFHAWCLHRQSTWPAAMTTLATHDTKRGEDVRARLAVLSEIPDEWAAAVHRWSARAERHRDAGRPDRHLEYLLWQTLVGAHPLPEDRAVGYAEKAAREAKRHTSWTDPDPAYEDAVRHFVRAVLSDSELARDLAGFVARIRAAGWVTSLAQKLVQLTMPGVPDVYQGTELWDLSLVDPDNRRPVDYALRRRLLDLVDQPPAGDDVAAGLPKLRVVATALRLRRDRPELFGRDGGYQPLPADGPLADHVVAFERGDAAVTVVPRLALRLGDGWRGTALELPAGRWHDLLGGGRCQGGRQPLDDLLARFPVALLVREGG